VPRLSRRQHLYRRILPAYWVYLFCITHLPGLRLHVGFLAADKLCHVMFFGLLAFLFWRFVETFRKPTPSWLVWLALVWIGLYAALDEWSQDFVRRGTDVIDWLADTLGVLVVLAVLEWRRRVNAGRATVAAERAVDVAVHSR
jgi:VanZ family protein